MIVNQCHCVSLKFVKTILEESDFDCASKNQLYRNFTLVYLDFILAIIIDCYFSSNNF